MSLKIAQYLAWRYIRGSYHNTTVSTLTKVCFFAIAISTFSLTIELFIMNGFDKALTEKMQSIYPNIILEAPEENSFDFNVIQKKLLSSYPQYIEACAPQHNKRIVIQSYGSNSTSAIYFKAVDPLLESSVSSLQEKIVNHTSLQEALGDDKVIIGTALADFLNVTVGDTLTLLFTQDDEFNTQHIDFTSRTVTIGGLLKTGIVQYDKYLLVGSHHLMHTLIHEDLITEIGIKLKKGINDTTFMNILEKDFKTKVNSWKTLYPALVSASELEKYVMFILLTIIILIATTNLIALLFVYINNKKRDIAILQTLGMTKQHITILFTNVGLIITLIATTFGIATAFIVGYLLKIYPFITLPDCYYVTTLPIDLDISIACIVFSITLLISFIITFLTARTAQSISITTVLRFDN